MNALDFKTQPKGEKNERLFLFKSPIARIKYESPKTINDELYTFLDESNKFENKTDILAKNTPVLEIIALNNNDPFKLIPSILSKRSPNPIVINDKKFIKNITRNNEA